MKDLKYGGNMYVILVYDISTDDNGARISRNIFKICKKYLTHVQKSAFEGEITPVLLRKFYLELKIYIREDKDEKFLICRPLIMEKLYGIDRNFENIVNIGFKCIIKKIIFRECHYFL